MTQLTFKQGFVVLVCGMLFGFGLALATMISPEIVLGFLRGQDYGLMLVMGGALAVSLLCYQIGPRVLPRPLMGESFLLRPSRMDRDTLLGAAIFGLGWGVCGVCPGPAIAGLGAGNWPLLAALIGIALGAYLQGRWKAQN